MLTSTRSPAHRGRTRLATVLLSVLAATAVGHHSLALAHPFGPPLQANVATDDDLVLVGWGAAEDDWVALGRALGVLDGPTATIDPEATVPRTGFEHLTESEAIAFYLLDHIQVVQDGQACEGEVSFPDDLPTLLATGALVQFTCPSHLEGGVELTITTLTDLHESYRTVTSVVGTEQRVVHTLDDPTHTVDPDAEPFTLGRGHLASVTGLGALLCLAVGLLAGRRRPDRPPHAAATEPETLHDSTIARAVTVPVEASGADGQES